MGNIFSSPPPAGKSIATVAAVGLGCYIMWQWFLKSWLLTGTKKLLYSFSNKHIKMLEAACKNAQKENNTLLFSIINQNKATEYGKKYDFASIKTIEDFKNKVPLTYYDDYKPYIDRMIKMKNSGGILAADDVIYYCTSSGTTGDPKLLPLTHAMLSDLSMTAGLSSAYGKLVAKQFRAPYYNEANSLSIVIPKSRARISKTPGGIHYGPLSQMNPGNGFILFVYTLLLVVPFDIVQHVEHYESVFVMNVLWGLADKDVISVGAAFAPSLLHFFHLLQNLKDELLLALETGKVEKVKIIEANVPKSQIKLLNDRLCKDFSVSTRKNRVAFLQKQFAKGMEGIAPRIWLNLGYVMTSLSGPFLVHKEEILSFIGSTPICGALYMASEGCFGVSTTPNSLDYTFVTYSVFYEFIKEEEIANENPTTYLLTELEANKNYEMVLTNKAGFCRYRVGDVVRVSAVDETTKFPKMQYLYRIGSLLDVHGEKTTEKHISAAMEVACSSWDVSIREWTATIDLAHMPARYVVYIELVEQSGEVPTIDLSSFDKHLQTANKNYAGCRSGNKLAPLQCKQLKTGTFDLLIKNICAKSNASVVQVKVPHNMKQQHKQFFEDQVIASS